jgi:hypothetical protein
MLNMLVALFPTPSLTAGELADQVWLEKAVDANAPMTPRIRPPWYVLVPDLVLSVAGLATPDRAPLVAVMSATAVYPDGIVSSYSLPLTVADVLL